MKIANKPIDARVESILCDPMSKEELRRDADGYAGKSRRYPFVRGIPRFVENDHYVSSFSFEWNTHHSTQLDRFRGDRSSEEQFAKKTGFSQADLSGKLVLDAGVGAGRYADVASRWGADVVGVDLSYAVEAAYKTFTDQPNVWIAQADIGKLPFKPESFDAIFSIGVLHHTPDTKAYFRKLVPLLKPGGQIVIWVYPNDGEYVLRQKWVRFINKIPTKMYYQWCKWFIPIAISNPENPWVEAIRKAFPYSHQGLGIENDVLDTFDGFSPRYHGIHSPDEVEGWFREAGLVDIVQPSDWRTCVRGRKPE